MRLFTIWKNCTVGKNYFDELQHTGITVGDSCKMAISKI